MQYFLSLLPVLACPVGMGLMMWLMIRGKKDPTTPGADQVLMSTDSEPLEDTEPQKAVNALSKITNTLKMVNMCLNWKAVAGLAVVGLMIGVVAPGLLLGAIPMLILVACPLSMLFMMGDMRGNKGRGEFGKLVLRVG